MPTVLRIGRYRFFFYSNESQEPAHIHVEAAENQAKFWLEPISLAANQGFRSRDLNEIEQLVREHVEHFRESWNSTSVKKGNSMVGRAYVPTAALAQSVDFSEDMMNVHLTDGRVLSVPLIWFPILQQATPEQRERVKIGAGGRGLRWPDLDEDISIAGLMAGVDTRCA